MKRFLCAGEGCVSKVRGILYIRLFSFALIISFVNKSYSQTEFTSLKNDFFRSLSIGDSLPDELLNFSFHAITKSGDSIIKLSDLSDKLIVFDFWATWCGTCVNTLKNLNSEYLNKESQVLVIPVTYQPKEIVENFYLNKGFFFPSIINDSYLSKYFPHSSLPHVIWIKNQKVLSISHGYTLTDKYLNDDINEDIIKNFKYKFELKDFKPNQPLLTQFPELVLNNNSIFSTVSNYIPGLNNRSYRVNLNDGYIMITNVPIIYLYKTAFQNFIHPSISNQVLFELDDELKFRIQPPRDLNAEDYIEWLKDNSYCYNLFFPKELFPNKELVLNKMLFDLNNYFENYLGIYASIEKREIPVLFLEDSSRNDNSINQYNVNDYANDWVKGNLNVLANYISSQSKLIEIPIFSSGSLSKTYIIRKEILNYPMEELIENLEKSGIIAKVGYKNLSVIVFKRKQSKL